MKHNFQPVLVYRQHQFPKSYPLFLGKIMIQSSTGSGRLSIGEAERSLAPGRYSHCGTRLGDQKTPKPGPENACSLNNTVLLVTYL